MTLNELFIKCATRHPKDGPFEIPAILWAELYIEIKKRRDAEGKPVLSAAIDRPNFLCGGIPVVSQ